MSETPGSLRPADPPVPRRLNSFALVLLSLAGALLLATVVYFVSQRPAPPAAALPPAHPDSEVSEPAFLQKPARPEPHSPGPDPAELAALEALARARPSDGAPAQLPGGPAGRDSASPADPSPYPSPLASPASASPSPPADPRREAYLRALRSPLSVSAAAPAGRPASGPPGGSDLFAALPPLRLPGLSEPLVAQGPRESAPPLDPTAAFLASAQSPRDPRLAATVDPPLFATQLDAGSLLSAVLVTAINSDLPGDLVAQVSRDVFDSRTERHLLVPRGSRLLGRYQDQIAAGQNRLLVAWDRLLFPDGTSLRFPGLPGTSAAGEAGLPATVDNHLSTVFGSALLLSLVSAGAQLSQPQESAAFGQAASARQVGAAALGQELSTVAVELLRRRLAIAPTLHIPAGTEFQILLRADLPLSPYLR